MKAATIFPIAAVAALALAGCQQPRQIYADKGYVRLSPVKDRPAVAYFTLHGGKADTVLLSVTSPAVVKSELHESMTKGGMAMMKPVQSVPLPARSRIEFKPGGRHVMLFGVNPSVQPGGTMPLVFTFANNERIELDVPVISTGDMPPQ